MGESVVTNCDDFDFLMEFMVVVSDKWGEEVASLCCHFRVPSFGFDEVVEGSEFLLQFGVSFFVMYMPASSLVFSDVLTKPFVVGGVDAFFWVIDVVEGLCYLIVHILCVEWSEGVNGEGEDGGTSVYRAEAIRDFIGVCVGVSLGSSAAGCGCGLCLGVWCRIGLWWGGGFVLFLFLKCMEYGLGMELTGSFECGSGGEDRFSVVGG